MYKFIFCFLILGFYFAFDKEITLADSNLQNSQALEQRSQWLYENGKLTEAISFLRQAIVNYRSQGDVIGEAIALRNLALVYQQLGNWKEAEKIISDCLKILPKITEEIEYQRLLAQALDVRGQIQLSLSHAEQALDTWKQAAEIYQNINDVSGFTRSKIYQATALQTLGLYAQAIDSLTEIQQQLKTESDTLIKSKALLSLGDVLRRVGKNQEAKLALKESLKIAEKLQSEQAIADALLGLGNTAKVEKKYRDALAYYQRAVQTSPFPETKLQGKLDILSLRINNKARSESIITVAEIENLLNELSQSRTAIYGRINLAQNLMKIENNDSQKIVNLLVVAMEKARDLGDKRAEADALGYLGNLYEKHQHLEEAQKLTEKALLFAQGINAPDLTYQWQWQLGRILKAKGDKKNAIAVYKNATETLQSLRGDLVAISSQVQFSFRESVEPIYRELADLLLQPGASQTNLKQAREIIEALQLAQLDNFFRDACLDTKPVQIDQLDPSAAIVYTIILPDRLETITAIPEQPLRHYTTNLSQKKIEQTTFSANSTIQSYWLPVDLEPLQQLYDWLIRPIEGDLAANQIQTLVFIQDGVLRDIPPAVFHDGKNYLIEKHNIAIAPSLQLIDPQPFAIRNRELLLAGLTEARQGFIALPGVKLELESIEAQFPAELLLDKSFTEANFDKTVTTSPYEIVHIATHGQFSSEAENTFILTWDGRITIDEFNNLLRGDKQQIRPIELLVLSACQTAIGDKQATLGLAGMAVRAGARSTIATLWDVNDISTTQLMTYFYQKLSDNLPKAEALRHSQQKILQEPSFSHPYYWSGFILVGNWL
ncbi:CHAT domain-containing protein [Candidatus Gracilibacteria bacterium]|nr:CHAT domain-containing protein [Candidatus Gracilibacteria bacterium]